MLRSAQRQCGISRRSNRAGAIALRVVAFGLLLWFKGVPQAG